MSRKIYNRLSFMAVSWLDESTLLKSRRCLTFSQQSVQPRGIPAWRN
jgi:hypothetical protein